MYDTMKDFGSVNIWSWHGLDMKNNQIKNVADPDQASDGVNKQYVDILRQLAQ